MKRCRDERTVTSRLSQSNQVRETTDSTTRDEGRSRRRRSHACDHGHIRAYRLTDSCEVEHDHRAHTSVDGASREIVELVGRNVQPRRDWNPVAQVETEGDRRLSQRGANRRQDIERLERFEPDNGSRGAESERLARARRRRDRGVQPERRDRCQAGDERLVSQESADAPGSCVRGSAVIASRSAAYSSVRPSRSTYVPRERSDPHRSGSRLQPRPAHSGHALRVVRVPLCRRPDQ